MAITYPRTMIPEGIGSQRFELFRVDYSSPTVSGSVASVTAGWPLWSGSWSFTGMTEMQASEWRAWVASLRGSQKLFLGRDLRRSVPIAYRNVGLGAFSGDAASWSVNGNRDVLTLTGLPSGFQLSTGDYVGFRWGSDPVRHAMVRVMEAGTGPSVTLAVEPPVPSVVSGGAVAYVKDPACLMRLTPETELGDVGLEGIVTGRIAGIQTLLP